MPADIVEGFECPNGHKSVIKKTITKISPMGAVTGVPKKVRVLECLSCGWKKELD